MLYKPLAIARKEIRLLRLAPGPVHLKPCCELEPASLNSLPVPDYEAVSYTWGNPNDFGEIICHGQPLIVPKSAEMALRGLRLENQSKVLWIDAICINQSNREEREKQVAIMGDVYKNATRTLVWLGQDDADFAETVCSIRDVLDEMREKTDGLKQLKSFIL